MHYSAQAAPVVYHKIKSHRIQNGRPMALNMDQPSTDHFRAQ